MKRIILACCMFVSLATASIHAQVTIGKKEKPLAGALLDLKNLNVTNVNDPTADKGLMLPRVALTDSEKLYPMFIAGYNNDENAKHIGLVVFNTGTSDVDLCEGIYVWTGDRWNRIPEPCNETRISTHTLLFYKSALAAKGITLDFSLDDATVVWSDDPLAPINWAAGGFAAAVSRKVSKKFTFKPSVNAGGERTAMVTATISSGGKTTTETVSIKQLDREMEFIMPTTTYPVVGAEHSLTINSEADWTATISATNPGTMITKMVDNSQEAGNNQTLKLTLASNDTWGERIAKLNITSTNSDFMPRTIDVKQAVATPALVVATPANKIIDFGVVTNAANQKQTVTFSTNSNWIITADAQYANVIGGSTTALNTNTAGGSPSTTVNKTITFTPNGTNTAAANTKYETKITMKSNNHSSRPVTTQVLTVRRTVASTFGAFTANPVNNTLLLRSGQVVKLTAPTNRWWKIRETAGNSTVEMAASAQGSKTQQLTVSANNTWTERTGIKLQYSLDNKTFADVVTYRQKPYDLAYKSTTALAGSVGGKVSRLGNAGAKVVLRSNNGHPNTNHIHIVYHDQNNTRQTMKFENLPGIVNPTTEAAKDRTYTTPIPVNNTWKERTYEIHFYRTSWIFSGTKFIQHCYDLMSGAGNIPNVIPGKEANSVYYANTVSNNGCPAFRVAVTDKPLNAQGQPTGNLLWTSGAGGVGNRFFNVPSNMAIPARTLYFIVEQAGNNRWILAKQATQSGQPWIDAGTFYIFQPNVDGSSLGITNFQFYHNPDQFCSRVMRDQGYGDGWSTLIGVDLNKANGNGGYPPAFGSYGHWSNIIYANSNGQNMSITNYVSYINGVKFFEDTPGHTSGATTTQPNNPFKQGQRMFCGKHK